jgi:hypothetical protein
MFPFFSTGSATPVKVLVMPIFDDQMRAKFEALPDGIPDVIDAAMEFFFVVQQHKKVVTIQALVDGLSLAMAEGHDMAELYLAMLSNAVRLAKSEIEA